MRKKTIINSAFWALLATAIVPGIKAQDLAEHGSSLNTLSADKNMLRDADSISMQPLEYIWCADGGEDCVWDFSSTQEGHGPYPINFYVDSLGNYVKTEYGNATTYQLNGGMLQQTKFESRFESIEYSEPVLSICFPFNYGDSITTSFTGKGTYCGDHLLRKHGQTTVIADGYGKLIFSEKDTIDNVLRIYTLTTTSIAMDMDSVSLDTASVKQEITEQYEWYAQGYRYPLLKTILRTTYSDLDYVASQKVAYRILPDDYELPNSDESNDSVRKERSLQSIQENEEKDIFHYQVQTIGNNVVVSYTLDEDAKINTLVSDVAGYVFRRKSMTLAAGSDGNIEIDCSGLRQGNYVLYMNVNGIIYNSKVKL